MNSINTLLTRLDTFRTRVKINPYLFAFLLLTISMLIQSVLNTYTNQIDYSIFVICIFLTAWYGGFFPCIAATIVGFLLVDYYFIPPLHSILPKKADYVIAIIFLIEGILFGLMGEARIKRETELNKAYEAEQRARKDAEAANRIRDDFISMASHELKTPITSQKLYLQMVQKNVDLNTNPKLARYIRLVSTQTDRIVNLINDLLNVARIRAGKFVMHYTPTTISEVVYDVLQEIAPINTTHNIILKGHNTKSIEIDKERISEVLINLLSNAMKYSPEAEKIMLTITEKNKQVIVSVKDYGIGINKTNQKKLFTRYFRAEGTNEQKYEGFGMGLFIVSEIIRQHKGKIWVKSTEGKGSTFSFSLPIAKKAYQKIS